ncbi:MAG: hypothetical protein M1821_001249 [Bathelium mastoideum]|nr:MAG: hypothetical protein M1821_001249 [Bathelium mastoideum]
MDKTARPPSSLFEVYLRLRFSLEVGGDRFLEVENGEPSYPTHITIKPPASDSRKRAVERFAFTRVFEEKATQLDIFEGTGVLPLIDGVLGSERKEGRDALVATLGVTGSGKTHTILGSKTQRGLIQLTLDVLYNTLRDHLIEFQDEPIAFSSLVAADNSEAFVVPASHFLDNIYGDGQSERGNSRATTPLLVGKPSALPLPTCNPNVPFHMSSNSLYPTLPVLNASSPTKTNPDSHRQNFISTAKAALGWTLKTRSFANKETVAAVKESSSYINLSKRHIPRPSGLPQIPNVDNFHLNADKTCEYAIVVSMYEVYNDRIFDLLGGSIGQMKNGPQRRRALLFKSTEQSPDRKVVAGLKKVVCGTFEEAIMVLETGLMERKVAGTGSNSASSRSHGFFCLEVKKRDRVTKGPWSGSTMTVVDLAGSERARNARTAGATLAEAGKINESLMYLGQCMQLQSDNQDGNKVSSLLATVTATKCLAHTLPQQNIVPFRQCKLTELLFSNSFPSISTNAHHTPFRHHPHRPPQKAIMIVTADPLGDFNATSQILRYSALAREVTVPRIPSVTSTILSGSTTRPNPTSGRTTPPHSSTCTCTTSSSSSATLADELDATQRELARLAEELDIAQLRLAEEATRRRGAEASWKAAEERGAGIEAAVREECCAEMEARIVAERTRWMGAWADEAGRAEAHLDAKVAILQRGMEAEEEEGGNGGDWGIYEDPEPSGEERRRELEEENARLRERVEALEREKVGRSPTKKVRALKAKKWGLEEMGMESP